MGTKLFTDIILHLLKKKLWIQFSQIFETRSNQHFLTNSNTKESVVLCSTVLGNLFRALDKHECNNSTGTLMPDVHVYDM